MQYTKIYDIKPIKQNTILHYNFALKESEMNSQQKSSLSLNGRSFTSARSNTTVRQSSSSQAAAAVRAVHVNIPESYLQRLIIYKIMTFRTLKAISFLIGHIPFIPFMLSTL